jgi:hypothetical protein
LHECTGKVARPCSEIFLQDESTPLASGMPF